MTAEAQKTIRMVILIIVGIILVYLAWIIFHRSKPPDESYKQELAIKDSLIAMKEENRQLLKELNAEKNKSITLHQQNDSLLKIRVTTINRRYETIPGTVNSYDKSQLRDAISKY